MTATLDTITNLHHGWVAANKDADVDWLRGNVHPDFVMWNTVGSDFLGLDAVVDLWNRLRAIASEHAPSIAAVSESWGEHYLIGDTIAVVYGHSRLQVNFGDSATGIEAGGSLDQNYRCTEVYHRRDGAWKMLHYHGSPHTAGLLGGV